MRKLLAIATITIVGGAGMALAQYKPQAPPQPAPPAPGPVQITPSAGAPLTPQPEEPLESARRISRDEARKMVKAGQAVYIDVRSKDSYDQGHIPGAISIPLSELPTRLRDLPVKKFLITYCA